MKLVYRNAAVLLLAAAVTGGCSSLPWTRTPAAQQHVVATVNGTPITQEEIDADIAKKLAGGADRMSAEQLEQIKSRLQEKALESFVTRTVLAQECEKEAITASQEEVDEALDEMTATLPEDMTLEQALESNGTTLETLRSDIEFGLKANKLIEANVGTPPPPSREELLTFYEQNKSSFTVPESVQASHILIKFSPDDDEAARAEKRDRIEALRTKLISGADFAGVAAQNSDCPSKSRGGNLGWFGRGRMVKEFDEAAFSQSVNEIGPVIETSFGYHIILVHARKAAGERPFDEVHDQIRAHLEQKNKNAAVRAYIQELKDASDIVYANG